MQVLITERTDITLSLGTDWMKMFKLLIGTTQLAKNSQSEHEEVFNRLSDLLKNNEAIEDTEIVIHLKLGYYPVKQNAKRVPLHPQEDMGRELEKLIKFEHLKN